MITHLIAIAILALTYGALWHKQPARPRDDEPCDEDGSRPPLLARLANRALEWLVLMPHVSNPAEQKEPVLIMEQSAMPERHTEFFRPVLAAVRSWKPWRRIVLGRAAVVAPTRASRFESKADPNELAAGRAI